MKRKLMPAIYFLAHQKLLPAGFKLVAVGREKMDVAAYIQSMRSALDESDEIKSVDDEAWQWLAARMKYAFGDLATTEAYDSVRRCFDEIEKDLPENQRNRIFYLAIPPSVFETTIDHLAKSGLAPRTPSAKTRDAAPSAEPMAHATLARSEHDEADRRGRERRAGGPRGDHRGP